MSLPTRDKAQKFLKTHVKNEYQLHHAEMVATAMEAYAENFGEDKNLWYITGLLHDVDFEKYPDTHPGESLKWFKERAYPGELIHAVEAHAYGYNSYTTRPETRLAAALIACDEISGLFYAYKKINPIPYSDMKTSSIKKRFNEKKFAAKIDREGIMVGCELLGVTLTDHIQNLINAFKKL